MSTAALSSSPLVYIECDIPAGMTVRAWRASRRPAAPMSRMSGVLRRVRRVRRARRRNGA
jgi:hypothetical protein